MSFLEKVKKYKITASTDLEHFLDCVEQYVSPMPGNLYNELSLLISAAENLPKQLLSKYRNYPHEVYRGTSLSSVEMKNINRGKSLKMNASSWSKDEDEAEKFAQGHHGKDDDRIPVVLSYKPKKTDIAIDLEGMASDGIFDDSDIDAQRILAESEIILYTISVNKKNIRLVDEP